MKFFPIFVIPSTLALVAAGSPSEFVVQHQDVKTQEQENPDASAALDAKTHPDVFEPLFHHHEESAKSGQVVNDGQSRNLGSLALELGRAALSGGSSGGSRPGSLPSAPTSIGGIFSNLALAVADENSTRSRTLSNGLRALANRFVAQLQTRLHAVKYFIEQLEQAIKEVPQNSAKVEEKLQSLKLRFPLLKSSLGTLNDQNTGTEDLSHISTSATSMETALLSATATNIGEKIANIKQIGDNIKLRVKNVAVQNGVSEVDFNARLTGAPSFVVAAQQLQQQQTNPSFMAALGRNVLRAAVGSTSRTRVVPTAAPRGQ